ncbi:hypothetical protein N7468_009620 [Penicillium chermesinum]|uniref:Nitroreductase domain-containing protein n=1 Tax=Penicillium chermesinum TaxID=63820 RepID=A0A9W9TF62_9EURO|nr:uncharacterized protein N7468_009620 [Penicillium chermesinum]KAJ5220416.1 hypothetical protein N7468_009620 [Penicillium chermesinum]
MSAIASSFIEGLKGRRSIYALTNESTVPNERIEGLISEVLQHTPSAFNTQTTRIVVLLKEQHEKLWDIAYETAFAASTPEMFEKLYKPRIAMFRAAYGTVLFYEDPAPFEALKTKWPMLVEKFPEWSLQTSGMHQLGVWTLLETEGLGASLQHYSPLIDDRVSHEWDIPAAWSLQAQLVFGKPIGPPREKTFEPVEKRLFVHVLHELPGLDRTPAGLFLEVHEPSDHENIV